MIHVQMLAARDGWHHFERYGKKSMKAISRVICTLRHHKWDDLERIKPDQCAFRTKCSRCGEALKGSSTMRHEWQEWVEIESCVFERSCAIDGAIEKEERHQLVAIDDTYHKCEKCSVKQEHKYDVDSHETCSACEGTGQTLSYDYRDVYCSCDGGSITVTNALCACGQKRP